MVRQALSDNLRSCTLKSDYFPKKKNYRTMMLCKSIVEISCQKCNPRLIDLHYIYRKIHKKAKRQTNSNGIALIEKTISQDF